MKKLSLFILTLLAASCMLGSALTASVYADLVQDAQCTGSSCVTCCDPAAPTCTGNDPAKCGDDCSKNNGCDIVGKYVNPFIKFLGILVGIAVTVGIIWGGIEYSRSAGDPQQAANGRRHIRVAAIALISYFFIYAFIHFLMPAGT
jgi:hypothetical protein